MALVERCRASGVSHGWNDCMCAATAVKTSSPLSPPLVLLATWSINPPAQLPRSYSHLAKFIIWKVVEQKPQLHDPPPAASRPHKSLFFLGFLASKHSLKPQLLFHSSTENFMPMKPTHFGFQSFSRLVQRNRSFLNYVSEQFVAQSSATVFPPTMFTLALPGPYMNHQHAEATTQPQVWWRQHMGEPKETFSLLEEMRAPVVCSAPDNMTLSPRVTTK